MQVDVNNKIMDAGPENPRPSPRRRLLRGSPSLESSAGLLESPRAPSADPGSPSLESRTCVGAGRGRAVGEWSVTHARPLELRMQNDGCESSEEAKMGKESVSGKTHTRSHQGHRRPLPGPLRRVP